MEPAELITEEPTVRFRRRPVPIAPEIRSLWRIAAVLVLLRVAGRGPTCRSSLRRLHVLSWGSRTDAAFARLKRELEEDSIRGGPFVRVDPALNTALDLAIGEGFVTREAGAKFALTSDGLTCADEIISAQLLVAEASRCRDLKTAATERRITELLRSANQ